MATRKSSRIAQDGKTVLSRAQEIISQKNLEKPPKKGIVEETAALIEALAAIVPQEGYPDMGQMSPAHGDQGSGHSPAAVSKKRRTSMLGPGTTKVGEHKPQLQLTAR